MTITINPTRNEFTATAAQTIFTYTFKIFVDTDLNVFQTPVGQACDDSTDLITTYTVTGVGDEDGGTIILNTPAILGDLITIISDIPENRTTDYQFNGDFIPSTVNDDFDRVVSIAKQTDERSDRSLQFEQCLQNVTALTLPSPNAGFFLRWRTDLLGMENTGAPGVILPATNVGLVLDLIADTSLIVGDIVSTSGYTSTGDGGDNLYEIVAAGTGTDDGGSFIDLVTFQAKALFPQGIRTFEQFGVIGDGDGSGGGTDNATALQAASDYIVANGGELTASDKIYRCDTGITMIRAAVPDAEILMINGRGGTIDCTNLTGSDIALKVGADTSAFFKDSGKIIIRALSIKGPETLSPETPANNPTTTTIGLRVQFAGNVYLENVFISKFHTNYQSEFSFPVTTNNVFSVASWICLDITDTSNTQLWNSLNVTNFRYGVVIRTKQSTPNAGIANITFINPRWETGINVMTVDPGGDTTDNVFGLTISTEFLANISDTPYRFCKAFTFSTPLVDGTDTIGQLHGIQWTGGRFSHVTTLVAGDTTNNSIIGGTVDIPYDIDLIVGSANFTLCDVTGYKNFNISHDTITRRFNADATEYFNFNMGTNPFFGMTAVSAGGEIRINKNQDANSFIEINNGNTGTSAATEYRAQSDATFGSFKAIGSGASSDANTLEINNSSANDILFKINDIEVTRFTVTDPAQVWRSQTSTANANALEFFSDVTSPDTNHMFVQGDGDIFNTNGTYGTISDELLKEILNPARSQWEDLKSIDYFNYYLLSEIAADLPGGPKERLGFGSRQVEAFSPGLVKTAKNGDKYGKYSLLYLKTSIGFQEAMKKIEALEAKNTALEARIDALEARIDALEKA